MPDPTQMDLKEIPESDRQKFGLKGRPIESDHHETEFQSDDQVVGDQDLSLVTHKYLSLISLLLKPIDFYAYFWYNQ